jgi:hypothetical protein
MCRRYSGHFGLAAWIAVVMALTSCSGQAATQPTSPYQREESEVRKVVFRDLLMDVRPGEVCFIALGMKDGGWIDPPQAFLEQLATPQVTLRKASEAQYPKRGEMDPENPSRFQGIRDPKTGKRSYVYYVEIESITPQLALVRAGSSGGPLSGGGYKSSVVRVNDRWVIKFDGPSWVH